MHAMLTILGSLLFLSFGFVATAAEVDPPRLTIQSEDPFVREWTVSARPKWVKVNGQRVFTLATVLRWRSDQKIRSIEVDPEDLNTRIKMNTDGANIDLMNRETKLRITAIDGKTHDAIIRVSPRALPFFSSQSCRRFQMNFKLIEPKPSSFLSSVACEKKDGKILMTFSAPRDSTVESTLFEISGKGEATRTYEFKMSHETIATKGLLGTITWGDESEQNTLQIGTKMDKPAEKTDKDKAPSQAKKEAKSRFASGYAGISIGNINLANQTTEKTQLSLLGSGEFSRPFGRSHFGYWGQADVLALGLSGDANINYSNIFVAGVYWLNSTNANFGFLAGSRWLTANSSQLSSGISAQSYSFGFVMDRVWTKEKKTYFRIESTPISQDTIKGSEISVKIRQDMEFFKKVFSIGLDYETLKVDKSSELNLKVDSLGLSVGMNF